MEALEEGLWESTWMEGVKVQVSSMVEQDGEGSASRKAMQDYRCLPRYLSQELWAVLLDEQQERAAALERLTHHSAKLGLRHPTEGTLAIMLATVWCVGSQQPSSSQMFELLTQNRLKIKKLLASHPQPPNYLQVLPALVEELPRELLILAFPEGAPAPCSRMDELSGKAAAWPLRKTSRLTGDQGDGSRVAETSGSTVAALGQFMAAMASGFLGATARAPAPVQPRITLLSPPGRTKEPLALQDGPLSSRPAEEVESQPLRPGQPSSIGGQPTQATAAQLGPDATQAHASSKMPDPASVLDGMRQDLLQARQQEQADPPAHRNKASKKPAAKAKARTLALKRPAGSCSALRRPAASQAAVGSQKLQWLPLHGILHAKLLAKADAEASSGRLSGMQSLPAASWPRPAWSVTQTCVVCGGTCAVPETQTCAVCGVSLPGARGPDLRGLWRHLRGAVQTCVVCSIGGGLPERRPAWSARGHLRTCGVPETQTCVVCGRTCGDADLRGLWAHLRGAGDADLRGLWAHLRGAGDADLRGLWAHLRGAGDADLRGLWIRSQMRGAMVMAADEEAKATSTSYSETEESGQNKPPVSPTSDAADTPPASEPVRPKEPAEPPKTSACVTRGNATKGKAPAGAPAGHCQWCWRKLGKAAAAQDQHTYSNLHCITWQMYESQSPPCQDWRAAQKAAERLKRNRDNQMYPERQSQPAASAHKAKQEEPDCSQPKVKRAASATTTRRKKKDKSKRKKDSSSPGSPSPAPKKKKEKKKKKLSSSDSSAEPRQKKRKGSGSLQGKIIINM
ncbi:unnamed protein product [Effrenium voratum]|nr:unnamed protein product [Effrenium voratum]